MSRQQRETTGLEIAIVGMSGRYPGAANLAELWANLRDGVEPITRFSDEELAETGLDASLLENPELIREGFVLGDIDLFDAAFFGYTPREAELIDPQQRIFLECAWEALEAAGCDPGRYPGPIGVFAGSGMSSYLVENLLPNRDIVRQVGGLQLTLANDKDYVATRAAYKMNLRGPAVCVQTACSTSLVAVHLACQSLLAGDCDVALAGGVSIRTRQKYGYVHQDGGIASRDGHCRPFDADASGTAGGNGVGIVVLKRLADALESGDRIEAVILGSAMNNDGSGKIGFTAPSVEGQAQAIEAAQRMAGVEPDDITYIEAHGTGTPLGDPMEIRALTRVFRARTHRKQFCGIGSIKSNFGHTDVAAGVAGLIKAVLALENRALPPSLHFERPNPEIDFESSPFYVNATLRDWTSEGAPRRAGVSSFGLGGTNVHVVLEEAPEPPAPAPARPWQVLTLSAQTEGALEEATRNLVEHLEAHPELELADVAYTLHVGRASFRTRRTVACRDVADAVAALGPPDPKRVWDAAQEFGEREVVFMFPGQGTQHVDMARGLYASEPVFREIVDECCGDLEADLGLDLRAVMHPESGDPEDCAERLRHTALAQPALFVVEYALARLWMSWGVVPSACIGHSIGEYVAACVSGVLSRRDALSLVAARGRLMGQTPPGAMLAIPRPENEVKAMLGDGMDLAAVNAPSLCVVSGTGAAMDRLQSELGERGIACQRLHTSHAFHSHLMDPVVERFASLVAGVPLSEPDRPFVSNVTGGWIDAATATDPSYWARHLREPVRFTDGLAALLEDPDRVLLEVGPGRTLASLAKQHPLCGPDRATASSMRHPTEPREDGQCLLDALGRLWAAGVRIDWEGFHATERRRRVPLPTYPFDRQRYWIDPPSGHRLGSGGGRTQPQRSRNAEDWLYVPSWKRSAMHTQREASPRLDEPARWLVFADGCGLADGLVERLERRGHEVWIARPGAAFQRLGEREFALAAADPEHYASLLEALGRLPDSIVHAWGVDSAEGVDGETLLDRCFFSPLFLAQAVGPRGTSEALDLAIVTSGIHEVTGTELPSPEKATALGPVGAISREYPAIRCRSVDVELERGAAGAAVEPLLAELALATGDRVVAYRGGHRWVRSVEPLRLELPEEEGGRLRQGGVYLVTGGLGGIGLTLAAFLARSVSARLILVARTPLPPPGQWESWLSSHPEDDVASRRIRAVRELEAQGGEVLVAAADVADRRQMADVLARARERFGEIHGVIHAAGVAGGGVIALKTREQAEAVLAPKVRGTRVLEELLRDTPLDFLLLCSSLTALVGGAGQVDYAAANAFLDAFAQRRRDGVTVSVDWDTWSDVGMAVETEVPPEFAEQRRRELAEGLGNEDGIEVFRRILGGSPPQVLVSTREPSAERSTAAAPAPQQEQHARPELDIEYEEPETEVERTVAAIWQQTLGIDRVGVHDNFYDLGGNSLTAVQVLSAIREQLGVRITPGEFTFQTVGQLAALCEEKRGAPEAAGEASPPRRGLLKTLGSTLSRGRRG